MQARARYLALRPPGNLARELCRLGEALFRAGGGPSARALPPYALVRRLRKGEAFSGEAAWSGLGGGFEGGAYRVEGSWLFLSLGGAAAESLGFGAKRRDEPGTARPSPAVVGLPAVGGLPAVVGLPAEGVGFPLLHLAGGAESLAFADGPLQAMPPPVISFRDAELVELGLSLAFDDVGRLCSAMWEELSACRRRTGPRARP